MPHHDPQNAIDEMFYAAAADNVQKPRSGERKKMET
jgi:hypothetical protein